MYLLRVVDIYIIIDAILLSILRRFQVWHGTTCEPKIDFSLHDCDLAKKRSNLTVPCKIPSSTR